jgi:CheY-like chemotaxis protein
MGAELHVLDQSPGRIPDIARTPNLDVLKGQFLASMNHEIRTPLTGILGMTELLLETQLSGDQREYVGAVYSCASQLLEMMNAILEYSSISAGQTRLEEGEIHLRETLEMVVADQIERAEVKGLAVRLAVDDDLPQYIVGDALRLRQMLSYLFSNAVKFTERGRVELIARRAAPDRLDFSVTDTGIGIPAEKLSQIFESFRQLENGLARSYAGLGLGLALAERLARLMGGGIKAVSEAGVGSTFTVTLPLRPAQATADEPVAARPVVNGHSKNKRVLLVEDSDIAQRIVRHILANTAYELDCVDGGREGVQAASEKLYDLILMDLQMPGVDGLAATGAIRELPNYEKVPIIALTANYSQDYHVLCQQLGMQGFLSKPVNKDELLSALAHFLKS